MASESITAPLDCLPTVDDILARIKACREEIAALKKLLRAVRALEDARDARERGE